MAKPVADESFCNFCIPYRLRTLAASLGEEALNVVRRLGLQRQSISWIAHIYEHDSDRTEMVFQLLYSCAAQNKSTFVKRLAQALHEEGREDPVKKLMRHQCKCSGEEAERNETESKTGCCWVHCGGRCTIL